MHRYLLICLCNSFRRPPLADDVGTKYTMLDPRFDKRHRVRFIENGVVISILNQIFRNDENKLLTIMSMLIMLWLLIFTDAAATTDEGSQDDG